MQNNQDGFLKEKNNSRFPCMICGEDHPTHRKDEIHNYLAQKNSPQEPISLAHHFTPQPQHMVATNISPPPGDMCIIVMKLAQRI
jgi:hypothetical protein